MLFFLLTAPLLHPTSVLEQPYTFPHFVTSLLQIVMGKGYNQLLSLSLPGLFTKVDKVLGFLQNSLTILQRLEIIKVNLNIRFKGPLIWYTADHDIKLS